MTALALTTPQRPTAPASPPAVDWSRWITSDQAARSLGVHPGTLKRRCQKLLHKRGDAMRCAGPDDNKTRWWINRRYDLRLGHGAAGQAHRAPDLGAYSEAQIDTAMQRAACVKRLWHKRSAETRPQKAWLAPLIDELRADHPGLKISRSTLFTWHAKYKDPADLVNLIDTRGGNTRGEPDPLCWDLFKQLYLTEHKRSRKWCWKQVKAKARADQLTWCSYPQLLRVVRNKLSPAERCKHRNPQEYRGKYSDYIDMDPDTWGAAETWIGDHSVLDMWCVPDGGGDPLRPWLTAWMDWKTRKIVGWVLCVSPNSQSILSAFTRAMRDDSNQGGPDTVYIDNGKDYAAETFAGKTKKQRRESKRVFSGAEYDQPTFRGLYAVLNIDVIFATPYNARAKGRLEQWFNYSLHQDFDKSWPSYAGNKPQNRPESLAAVLKSGTPGGAPGGVPTFSEVRDRIARHIDGYNRSCDHGKQDIDGLSPHEAMAMGRQRVFADPGVLDRFMLTYSRPVRVRRHRVSVPVLGKAMVYKSDDPVFADQNGREDEFRVGYDQDDLREATLFDERMRPVCRLYHATFGRATQAPGDTGAVSRTHLSEAIKKQRRLNRAKKLQAEAGLDQILSTAELALIESGKTPTANPQTPTPRSHPTRLVQTPVDGHANELQRQDLKQAAGGELSSSLDERFGLTDVAHFLDDVATGPIGGQPDDQDDRPIDITAFLAEGQAGAEEDEPVDPSDFLAGVRDG